MKSVRIPNGQSGELLRILALMAQVVNISMVAEYFCNGDRSNARRLIRRLLADKWVREVCGFGRRSAEVRIVASWRPGKDLPDAGRIAYMTRHWKELPASPMSVFAASGKSAAVHGVPVARVKRSQIGHDLGVTSVALRYLKNDPATARSWRGEIAMRHTRCGHGEKLPDAFIVDKDEQVVRVIEICSGYGADRVREFVGDCCERELPFEIWG